jgi:hypothetical protein
MPEPEAASLFWLTVRIPAEAVSPVVRAVSALAPSFRFHKMVRPVASKAMEVWSRKMTGVRTRWVVAQLGA